MTICLSCCCGCCVSSKVHDGNECAATTNPASPLLAPEKNESVSPLQDSSVSPDDGDKEPIYAVVKKKPRGARSSSNSGVQCTFLVCSSQVLEHSAAIITWRSACIRGGGTRPKRTTVSALSRNFIYYVTNCDPEMQSMHNFIALLELPHHLGGSESNRHELIVLRSDDGDNWREHDPKQVHCESSWSGQDEEIYEQVMTPASLGAEEDLATTRIVRLSLHRRVLPKYVCLISRVPNVVASMGPEGGALEHDRVKVTFPPGAIQKTIKVGLSARKLGQPEDCANSLRFGPVITLSPGGRKFREAVRISMDSSIFGADLDSKEAKVLAFCCMSVTEETQKPDVWEEVTEKICLQRSKANNRLAFESKVSGRFWLILQRPSAASIAPFTNKEASLMYRELLKVTYVASLTVFYCSHFPKAWFDTVRVYISLGKGVQERFMEENILVSNEPWKRLIDRVDFELHNDTRYEVHLEGNLGFAPDVKLLSDFVFKPPNEVALTLVTRQLEPSLPKTGYLVFEEKLDGMAARGGKHAEARAHSTWYLDPR